MEPSLVSLLDEGRQFQLLVHGVTDYAIYLLDPAGHIASWNPGGERIKGYARDEVIGKHFSMFYTPEDRDNGEPAKALRTAVDFGKYERDGWRLRKDGTRFWASVVIDPVFQDGALIGYAKVTRDISERLKSQQALEEAQRAFLQSQKAEAISQLTYGLAHDFNNLLTVIGNSLDRIVASNGDMSRILPMVATAQRASDRGALLTKQLLAFSRGQTAKPRTQDVNAIVRAAEPLFRRACDATMDFRIDLQPHLPHVDVDGAQLEAALLNLVINARDAMPDGGRIEVGTRLAVGPERHEKVVITVRDFGQGMSPEVRDRALDPFFTTKEVGKGSGLGLSQVYGVVTQAGGSVAIDSIVGGGTTVSLHLPVSERSGTGPGAAPALRILMVDDDDAILETIVDALRDLGYAVTAAHNGAEALERLAEDAELDVLFSDVVMPGGLSGIDLARQALQDYPHLKVILASGYAESWLGELPKGVEFLPKPYRLARLVELLSQVAPQA